MYTRKTRTEAAPRRRKLKIDPANTVSASDGMLFGQVQRRNLYEYHQRNSPSRKQKGLKSPHEET